MTLLVLLIIDYCSKERERARLKEIYDASNRTHQQHGKGVMNVMSSSRALVKKGFVGPVCRYADTLTRPRIPGKAVQALPRAAQTQKRTNKQTNKTSLTSYLGTRRYVTRRKNDNISALRYVCIRTGKYCSYNILFFFFFFFSYSSIQ